MEMGCGAGRGSSMVLSLMKRVRLYRSVLSFECAQQALQIFECCGDDKLGRRGAPALRRVGKEPGLDYRALGSGFRPCFGCCASRKFSISF